MTLPLGMLAPLRPELNGVKVCILHDEPQSHGLPGEGADVRAALPGDDALDLIAVDLGALIEFEALDRIAGLVLDLHAHAAHGRGRVVDHQHLPLERQRLSHELAAGVRRIHGDEAIQPQRATLQIARRVGLVVALEPVDRQLLRAGLQ